MFLGLLDFCQRQAAVLTGGREWSRAAVGHTFAVPPGDLIVEVPSMRLT
jgi:hypothetical protein